LYFTFTAVIKPAVEEGKKVYDAEGLDVDLYSRWMYNVNDIKRRRAENAMSKRKRTNNNAQNTTQKTKTDQHEPH
jgi:hypothetical protein